MLTHRPEDEPDDPDVTFVSGGVEAALDLAFEKAQGKDVVLFGASLASQCLRAGLVGELVVHIIPVLLGRGTPLFPDDGPSFPLELEESYQAGQIPCFVRAGYDSLTQATLLIEGLAAWTVFPRGLGGRSLSISFARGGPYCE